MPCISIDPCSFTIEIYSKDVKNSLSIDYVTDLSINIKHIVKYDGLFEYNRDFANMFLVF